MSPAILEMSYRSGRNKNEEEKSFIHEYELKGLAFRAARCFFLAKSYSSASKRAEAYALFCHEQTLSGFSQQLANSPDKALIQDLKSLSNNCRSNSCIEHVTGIMEEYSVPLKLSKGVSTISLDDKTKVLMTYRYLAQEQVSS
ncbi:signal recognition particle subunit SRP68-like [Panicum hallii]|uniref:signal recognition particle subunit SRP68-like n=1 Tax=Panicum hallii TaxID=206008 RepID=UPI000DF4D3F1|nr:signal recognition particle subunit SRP68-like [Panicum hallii]